MNIYRKLYLLLACIVCLSIVPLVFLLPSKVAEGNLEDEELAFTNASEILSASIRTTHFFLTYTEASKITEKRQILKHVGASLLRDMENTLRHTRLDRAEILQLAKLSIQGLAEKGFFLEIRLADGASITSNTHSVTALGLSDIKGRDITGIMKNLPPSGDFAVFEMPGNLVDHTFLAYFLPMRGEGVFANAVIIAYGGIGQFVNLPQFFLGDIVQEVNENLDRLALAPGAIFAVLDADNKIIVYRGDLEDKDEFTQSIAGQLLPGKSYSNMATFRSDPYFVQSRFVKTVDWHIVYAIPESALSKTGNSMVQQMLILGAFLLVFALLATHFVLRRTLRPLHALSASIKDFQQVAFKGEGGVAAGHKILAQFSRTPKGAADDTLGDELSSVSHSLAEMGREILKNIQKLQRYKENEERMHEEMVSAGEIQAQLLPEPHLSGADFALSAVLEAASEVGGDFFDHIPLHGTQVALVMGSGHGHGLKAALLMSRTVTQVRHVIWHESTHGASPEQILVSVQRHMFSSFNTMEETGVMLFLAIYDTSTGHLWYVNTGNGVAHLLSAAGARPMAVEKREEQQDQPAVHEDQLLPGEVLFCAGRGLIRTMNVYGERFGIRRLETLLQERCSALPEDGVSLRTLCRSVHTAVDSFSGGAPSHDDLTMLALVRTHGISGDC